jgi:cytidylate kinase
MKLIGLSGTNGAGKDSVGELLARKYNFLFISVTEMLRDECRTRNVPIDREHLRAISGEWRKEGGLGVLIDKAIEVYKKADKDYAGLAISSLRNPGEADRVHELGGSVLWVDAEVHTRYQRIQQANRGRGAEDDKTFEQFVAEQEAEMHGVPGDPTSLKMDAVKGKSDIFIDNDGDELEVFAEHVAFTLTEAGLL